MGFWLLSLAKSAGRYRLKPITTTTQNRPKCGGCASRIIGYCTPVGVGESRLRRDVGDVGASPESAVG